MADLKSYLKPDRCMTVGKLREQLERFNDDDVVLRAYTASDYWRSPIATRIQLVEEAEVFYTDYHQCAQEVDYSKDSGREDTVRVVVIR